MPDVVQFTGFSADVLLFYAMPMRGPGQVLDFCRKELPALGGTMRASTVKVEDGNPK